MSHLSKSEREALREAFRKAAWLEPSATDPNDPEASEWACYEDDAMFALVPVIEEIIAARTTTESSAGEQTGKDHRTAQDATGAKSEQVNGDEPGSPFDEFLSALPPLSEVVKMVEDITSGKGRPDLIMTGFNIFKTATNPR